MITLLYIADIITSPVVVECIGWLLVHSSWQFALIVALVFALGRAMRRRSAVARYWMLVTAMLLMVLSPLATWMILPSEEARLASMDTQTPLESPDLVGERREPSSDVADVFPLDERGGPRRTATEVVPPSVVITASDTPVAKPWWSVAAATLGPWLRTIVEVWCCGVLLFSVRPVWSWFMVRRLRRIGTSPVAATVQQALECMRARLQVTRRVEVVASSLVTSPIVVGCFRSIILLPASFIASVPVSQLEAILAHELAHVRRYDYPVNLLQTLVETVFFYHPAVWWLSHRIRIEREHCCDDLVVAALGNKVEYGRALLAVEQFRVTAASTLALGAKGGSLLNRVKRLFADPHGDDRSSGLVALAAVAAGLLATAVWASTLATGNLPEDEVNDAPFRLPDHWIIEDVRWIEGDKHLISASLQGGVNVRRWDVASRQLLSEIKLGSDQHGRPVRQGTIRLSADGSRAIAVTDAYVGVWDTSTGELLRQLPLPQKQWEYDTVRCLDSSKDGSVIVAGLGTSYSRTTQVYPSYGIAWDARSGAVLSTFEQETGYEVCDVAVTADGRRFATCSDGNRVCLWEARSGKLLGNYSKFAHDWKSPEPDLIKNNLVRGIDLSPDGQLLAIVGTFGIRLVDTTSGNLVHTINAPVSIGLGDVVLSSDGQYLARFGSRRGRHDPDSVLVWSLEKGEQLSAVVTPATVARFSSSGRQLAVGESDFYEAISIWPMAVGKRLGPLPPPDRILRINRVEENTHRRGESAAEVARRWQLRWGPAQHGLQYGIALTSAGNRFHIDQRVPMVVFLKNTSEQPLQFDFRPDMFGNPPRVTSADGKPAELARRDLLGQVARYRDKLEPGELFGPLYLNFGLGENPRPRTQEWTPHWGTPTPGVYNLTHRAPIYFADPKATGDTTGPDWLQGTLQTGSLEFEIVDARGGDDEDAAPDRPGPRPLSADEDGIRKTADEQMQSNLPWRARGKVVDGDGKPLAGVTVRAATGIGTLHGGGSGGTDEDGRYDFRFGMGIMFGRGDDGTLSPQTQYALISARLDDHFEQNFSRHGNGVASLEPVSAEDAEKWGVEPDQVCLPDKPREVNFVMLPAAKVSGVLIGEDDQPLKNYSVSLTGEKLPPGSSVLAQVRTDGNGRFEITEIPTTILYQFEVRKPRSELKPPWDDSWASPPLTFVDPGDNDLRTTLKSPLAITDHLTVKSLRLKIVGSGVHGKAATQRATQQPLELPSNGTTLSATGISLDEWTLRLSNEDDRKQQAPANGTPQP